MKVVAVWERALNTYISDIAFTRVLEDAGREAVRFRRFRWQPALYSSWESQRE
jgi:hypothetical protein